MSAKRIAIAAVCLVALGIAVTALLGGDSSADSERRAAVEVKRAPESTSGGEGSPPPSAAELGLAGALRKGVERVEGMGGTVEAAAMLDGLEEPVVVTSGRTGAERYMRMWSISKVATTVALLRLLGWGERPGETPSPEVDVALEGALTRSENCRQRRIVLELQRLAGGTESARRAFEGVFAEIGARAVPAIQLEEPEQLCVPFLSGQTELPDPLAPALLLGTSRWRVTDAARLAHALAVGTYGTAVSERVLELMRARKHASRETEPGELTAPLDWGAGAAFPGLIPAYKAAWGGALHGNFLAGQVVVVPLGGNDHLALAVMFHPDNQPSRDDPGITAAPEVVEELMRTTYEELLSIER